MKVNTARCTGCGRCISACPQRLFSFEVCGYRKHAVVGNDKGSCDSCLSCLAVCPVQALCAVAGGPGGSDGEFQSHAKTSSSEGV